jgi:hypothetical protein
MLRCIGEPSHLLTSAIARIVEHITHISLGMFIPQVLKVGPLRISKIPHMIQLSQESEVVVDKPGGWCSRRYDHRLFPCWSGQWMTSWNRQVIPWNIYNACKAFNLLLTGVSTEYTHPLPVPFPEYQRLYLYPVQPVRFLSHCGYLKVRILNTTEWTYHLTYVHCGGKKQIRSS